MNKFETLGLQKPIIDAIAELGFETPTPIQEKVIPNLLTGKTDLVALAQTGTGKTAAFGLPMLQLIDFNSKNTQALILCPTRELCMQITKDLKNFAKNMHKVSITAVYGGASIQNQLSDIKRGVQIIVATPGRMTDIINRKRVNLSTVKFVVLDEADEMLNMGFKEDLDMILSETPDEKNTWLFSATMPDEVLRISKKYMNNPMEITIGSKNQGAENIEHLYYVVHPRDKYAALKRIADFYPDIFAIVFCRTKRETQQVADAMIKDGYNADALHGDLSQAQRDLVMNRYRNRTLQMLIATDVAARGIDVDDVTHVINYNLPDELESYTHRSGRTARAGKKGISIVIISSSEIRKIKVLEHIIKKKFSHAEIPNGFEVCEKQLFHLVKKIHNIEVNEQAIASYLPQIYNELQELTREEIIKRFVSTEFNRFLDYYKNAPDLNISHREHPGNERREVKKLFVSLGTMDGLDNNSLANYICETAGIAKSNILWTNVKNSFSFFEVKSEFAENILNAFQNKIYRNRAIRMNLENERKEKRENDFPRKDRHHFEKNKRRDFHRGGEGNHFKKRKRFYSKDKGR